MKFTQKNAVTRFRCGDIFNHQLIANLQLELKIGKKNLAKLLANSVSCFFDSR